MRNANQGLQLLMVLLAVTAAEPRQLASAAGPALAEPWPPSATMPADIDFAPAETGVPVDGFSGYCPSAAPFWYFEVDGIALKRDASRDRDFAHRIVREWTEVVPAPPPDPPPTRQWELTDTVTDVLGTQSLPFDFRGGGRALVGRTLGDWHAVEVCYFAVDHWNEIAAIRDATPYVATVDLNGVPVLTYPASLFSPFSDFGDPPIPGLDYNNLAEIGYSSTLDSLEWNLRRRLSMPPGPLQGSVLVGGRYMHVRERFNYLTRSAVTPRGASNAVTTWTGNNMLGVQVGAEFDFQIEPEWWVDCEIKGVIFDNQADQSTTYVYTDNSGVEQTYGGAAAENRSTFALDVRLMFSYQVTPRLSTRIGYQALWVDGLALASENFNLHPTEGNLLRLDPATLVSGGKVVYHGPHLGATWMW